MRSPSKPTATTEVLQTVSDRLRDDREQLRLLASRARARLGTPSAWPISPALAPPSAPPVRGARLGEPAPLPPLTARPVKIRLPNNRWVRGHLAPAAARRDDLAALRRNIALNTKRAFAAIRENARAIDELAHAQQQLANIVAELQARGELSLLRDLVGRVEGLDQRVQVQQQALTTHSQSVSRQQGSLRKALNRQVRSARIQKLNAVATSMQVAAYGSKGNPLARNNLMLAGNELLWSFIGDLLRGFGIAGPGEISPLGWLAPVASLATGRVALGRQQHQRFLSGVATFPPPTDKTTLLRVTLDIADALWPSFRHRDDVPVTAIPLEPNSNAPVKGFVRDGVLLLVLSNALEFDDVRVAWMVDTGVGDG